MPFVASERMRERAASHPRTLISPVTFRLLPSKLKTASEFSTMLCSVRARSWDRRVSVYPYILGILVKRARPIRRSASVKSWQASVALLTDDSQIGANLRVCADEENRADFDQRR